MINLQLPKPVYIYLLYIFVRAYFLARKQDRDLYARALLTPIAGFAFINFYMIFTLPKWTIWFLVMLITVVSAFYFKGVFDVRKGQLNPDKKDLMPRSFILESIIVLILSIVLVKILGFDFFTGGF